jgi:hypothetical protein
MSAPDYIDWVTKTDAPQAGRWNSALAGDLEAIAAKALQRMPQARYFSPAQMSQDLTAYLEGRPVLARAGGWLYRCGRFARRHRAGLVAAFVAAVAALWLTTAIIENQRLRQVHAQLTRMPEELAARLGLQTTGLAGSFSIEDTKAILDFAQDYESRFLEAVKIQPQMTEDRRQVLLAANRALLGARTAAAHNPEQLYWAAYGHYALGLMSTKAGDPGTAVGAYGTAQEILRQLVTQNRSDRRVENLLNLIEANLRVARTMAAPENRP